MWAIPTGANWLLKKKKNQVMSPSPESRVPETGSDPPIGSGRDSGRDIICQSFVQKYNIHLKKYFNYYFLVTGNYHGSIHVLIILSVLYRSLVRLLEHNHVISCPLNSDILNILLLRLLQVTNYIAFC